MHNPFASFWMAGFECADQVNAFGNRVDLLQATGHIERLTQDYNGLGLFNMHTVREGIRWSRAEPLPYEYDWRAVAAVIQTAKKCGVQVIWDMCHFGFPDDLTPLHPHFTDRFCALCSAFVAYYRSVDPYSVLIITPFNEVGFLSWLGGDVAGTAPYCRNNGWQVKYALMKTYIRSIEVLKAADNNIRILTTEPLVNMVPPLDATPEQVLNAAQQHESQFEVLDILSGVICPELGGREAYLDILGFNYYYNNQWITEAGGSLPWKNEENDSRWKPLSALLAYAYNRYGRPLVLSETSHPGEDRPLWIAFVAAECHKLLLAGIPLWGICWYPAIARPDWDHLHNWHQSGLWDISCPETGDRLLHQLTAAAMLQAQRFTGQQ